MIDLREANKEDLELLYSMQLKGSVLNDHTDRDAYGYPGFLP